MINLAIIGTREFLNPNAKEQSREIIINKIQRLQPKEVGSGGANGIDSWAETIALELAYNFKPFLPRYRRWEPFGFKERNTNLANWCTHMLVIRCTSSKTYGSGWTRDLAISLGKDVESIEL